ncbi:MAG: ABC transporter permease [Lachnospiraceae bacterium]|nr:ABC transporter permease [Lachnospiraceae bacterium]
MRFIKDNIHITKPVGITIFSVFMFVMALVIGLHHNPLAVYQDELTKKIIAISIIVVAEIAFILLYDKVTVLPVELWQNRHLIWKLAKNDFKKRYAGSYLGAVWAMIQPVVTVVMYYIVFDVIMGAGDQAGARDTQIPYVLFLTAGLVPWFYFTEALNNGTQALMEYSYLVKKVVFKISILPIIKVIAATFIHAFFVIIMLIIAAFYGFYPTIYTIQIFYYSLCTFIFVLALCYSTCAIMVFFKDIAQIISILLQIGMWATPILWNIAAFDLKVQTYIKINPLVYIVEGYRSSICEKQWFFEDFYSTMYFWIFTVVLFGIWCLIFKRLKPHFADVL